MSSVNNIHAIFIQEFLANVFSKNIAGSSCGNSKARLVSFWITPHQISKRSFVRNFLYSIDFINVTNMMQSRRKPSMNSKNLIVNNSTNWKIIKDIRKILPHFWISILLLALRIKSIDLCNLPCFMISSQQTNSVRKPQFQNHQQGNYFNTLRASVNIVSHKKIVGIRNFSSNLKH
jgi:hypothetical protein